MKKKHHIQKDSDKATGRSIQSQHSTIRTPNQTRVVLSMVLTIAAIIFSAELFEVYFRPLEVVEALVLTLVLITVTTPMFYFFWYRPLCVQISKCSACENEARMLSHRLLKAGENERRKLARDLHDEFGHKLTSLQILINNLHQSLDAKQLPSINICQRIFDLVADLSNDLQKVLSDLRPEALDELGLIPAIENLCHEINIQQVELKVDFQFSGLKGRLHPDQEIVLFRVCQEGLTNALRHSRASNVLVRLTRSYPQIFLSIQDDGIGFSTDNNGAIRGRVSSQVGLIGLRERIASIGGTFQVASNPGGGTRLRVEIMERLSEDWGVS